MPFCGSYFKHACYQQVWAKVQQGKELHLQDCHLCVLFPEQTSLNLLSPPRREGLAGEVLQGLSSASMSHPHHRECKCCLCAGELDFPAQVVLHMMTGSWILNAATAQHQQCLQPLVSCWLSPSHSIAGRGVIQLISPLEKGKSSRNKDEEQTEDDTVCLLYSSLHFQVPVWLFYWLSPEPEPSHNK